MYLGLDLGTSGLKAVLIDGDGRLVASADAPLTVSRPHPGWSEQDPADWVAAASNALAALKASHPDALAAVRGIGLAGQQHGATCLDAADQPLRPAILWNDGRAFAEAETLNARPEVGAILENIVFAGFTAPKLVWLSVHEPEIFARTNRVLLPKDYLRLWLTGDAFSDMSDASGTGWLNIATRDWSDALLEITGMTRAQMPTVVEGTAPAGELRRELAAEWGMTASVVVAGGAGDNAAAAMGTGVVGDGDALLSIGTSGVLFATTQTFRPNLASAVHSFCHAAPHLWHQMGVMLSATDSLNWLAQVLRTPAAELVAALGDTLRPPGDCTFLPYLSGERTPHNDARARGVFAGLSHQTDADALTHAVLSGVAFAFRDNLDALTTSGTPINRLLAVGGGARSATWLRLIATVLERPIDVPADESLGAAFGAARLGLIAAENAPLESVATRPEIATTIDPDTALVEHYGEALNRFRALYPAVHAAKA